ncbi:MAG: DUF1801 domain-containing protein [Flavobacteriales bacterium]|nr:DUF1801 domain-containing protein [Flavobacteriales bacterium]
MPEDILQYHDALAPEDRVIAQFLFDAFIRSLPEATSKLWHGHPVWFMEGNPVAGYQRLKKGMRVLFWSGQSFSTPGLSPEGKFKAAEIYFHSIEEIQQAPLEQWLHESVLVQWDYKNIVKRKGQLIRLEVQGS